LQRLRAFDGGLAVVDGMRFVTQHFDERRHAVSGIDVVVDHHHLQVGGLRGRRLVIMSVFVSDGLRVFGQPYDERAALAASFAVRFDMPAMQIDDCARERQADAESTLVRLFFRRRFLHEEIEDCIDSGGIDAAPRVLDTDRDEAARAEHLHADRRALRTELRRIVQQVLHHLDHAREIAFDVHRRIGQRYVQCLPARGEKRRAAFDAQLRDGLHRHRLRLDLHASQRDTACVEQIVDEPREMRQLPVDQLVLGHERAMIRRLQLQHADRVAQRRERIAQLVSEQREELAHPLTRCFEFFESPATRHVARDLREPLQRAVRIAQRRRNDVRPEDRPVLAHAPLFDFDAAFARGKLQVALRPACGYVFGRIEQGRRFAHHFMRLIAHHLRRACAPRRDMTLRVEHRDRIVLDRVDEHAKALVEFARVEALGDVAHEIRKLGAAVELHGTHRHFSGKLGAVDAARDKLGAAAARVALRVFVRGLVCTPSRVVLRREPEHVERGVMRFAARRKQRVEYRASHHRFARIAERARCRIVPVDDDAVRVGAHECVVRRIEHEPAAQQRCFELAVRGFAQTDFGAQPRDRDRVLFDERAVLREHALMRHARCDQRRDVFQRFDVVGAKAVAPVRHQFDDACHFGVIEQRHDHHRHRADTLARLRIDARIVRRIAAVQKMLFA